MNTPAEGLRLDDRYELVAPADDRGAGAAWTARDLAHGGREVLVKLLRAHGEPSESEGLDATLRALRAFRHEGVPALLRAGVLGETAAAPRPWLAFERVGGDSLGTLLDRARRDEAPLALERLRAVADAVLAAIGAAHRAPLPLVHGALAPGSVIVRAGDGDATAPRVRVLDLGLAPFTEPAPDAPARSARSLVTAAPERYAGAPPTVATDVFALGALLLEMFATPAPPGQTLAAVDAGRRRPDVPRAVWDVIERAMQLEPAARFERVDAMRAALGEAWASAPPARRSAFAALLDPPGTPRARSLLESTAGGLAPRDIFAPAEPSAATPAPSTPATPAARTPAPAPARSAAPPMQAAPSTTAAPSPSAPRSTAAVRARLAALLETVRKDADDAPTMVLDEGPTRVADAATAAPPLVHASAQPPDEADLDEQPTVRADAAVLPAVAATLLLHPPAPPAPSPPPFAPPVAQHGPGPVLPVQPPITAPALAYTAAPAAPVPLRAPARSGRHDAALYLGLGAFAVVLAAVVAVLLVMALSRP